MLDSLVQFVTALGRYAWEPLRAVPWTNWSEFWVRNVLCPWDNRLAVLFFLPLVPVLFVWPRRHLRLGMIVTGCLFMGWLFGAAFVPVWVLMCYAFFCLGQRYAIDLERQNRLWWNPSAVVILLVSLGYLVSLRLKTVSMPGEWVYWLYGHAAWLFPFGSRPYGFETFCQPWSAETATKPPQLFDAIFMRPHTCGLVIFTIRMLHYFSEIKRRSIPAAQRTFLNFLSFCSFGPLVMQGPIERFAYFNEQVERCRDQRRPRDLLMGLLRISQGMGKALIYRLYFPLPWLVEAFSGDRTVDQIPYLTLVINIHIQVFALYLLFSAYCDVAIGLARLVGFRATENFRQYWLARSLTDVWRRWHITFSFILRDYVFMPLVRRRWSAVAALVVTFVVCGVLHNLDNYYVLWGVVMGLMAAVNQRWARWMRELDRHPQRRLTAIRRAWLRLQPLPKLCAWFVTINAFILSGYICLGKAGGLWILWELVRRPAAGLLQLLGLWPG
ncbi:MAG: MBOAT family O-acyltransferase [Phycisphaerae bacterium]